MCMSPNEYIIDKIYNTFERERKKHPTYKESKYDKESEYKELIKFLVEKEEVNEAELMLKAKEIGLGRLYYNTFIAILKKYLNFIDIGEEDGYKVIKITNELRNALNDNNESDKSNFKIDMEFIIMQYEDLLRKYLKNYITVVGPEKLERKIRLSARDLSAEFGDMIDYAIESVDNYYQVVDYLTKLFNEVYYEITYEMGDFKVVLCDFPALKIDVNKINAEHINKVVEFEANIIYASHVSVFVKKSVFQCPRCGKIVNIYLRDFFAKNSDKLVCNECNVKLQHIKDEEYTNFQELIVQGLPNEKGYIREQRVLYEDSDGVFSGYVKITGIVRTVPRNSKSKVYDLVAQAVDVEEIDNIAPRLTKKDIEDIKKIAKRKDVIDLLSDRLIPEIKGHSLVKKAVFLQQIRGVKKPGRRDKINILLITDPGIGKTVILRKIAEIPGNNYVSMPTSTINSVFAIAEKKKSLSGESWTVKVGPVPKSIGTVCIDEFYIPKGDTTFYEAMEGDVIHFCKGGIDARLQSVCSFLCARNPRWGRFNPDVSVAEQIDIPAPLLSRFDLIFPIRDRADKEADKEIAEHIIDVHRAYLDKEVNKKIRLDYVKIDGVIIDFEFIVKYIFYARQLKPTTTDEAKKKLVNWYVEMRKKHQITARQLESAIRLAEAHAKAKLKETVDVEDAEEAIGMITECLKEIAYDPEAGIIDIDKIAGTPKSEREKLDKVLNTIKELSNDNPDVLVDFEEILSFVEEKGINEKELERLLNKLKKLGDIDEPKPRRYRLI